MTLDKLPIVNWPRKSGEHKVVQLEIDNKPYLRFAEEGWETHAVILMYLFKRNNVPYKTIKDNVDSDVPALKGERYKIHGAGKAKIDLERKYASFGGESMGYGICIDKKHLDSIKELQPKWKIELK